jgi:hypothetical protein
MRVVILRERSDRRIYSASRRSFNARSAGTRFRMTACFIGSNRLA